jgi:hypothetical protein
MRREAEKMKPIEILKQEYRVIEQVLACFEEMANRALDTQQIDEATKERCLAGDASLLCLVQGIAMRDGYAFARSQGHIQGSVFQGLTWLRGLGIVLFVTGGVIPLAWLMVSRWACLRPPQAISEQIVMPPSALAAPDSSFTIAAADPEY